MADRIVVLNAGYIAQVGAPLELYHKPQNTFVAGFIGNPRMNFLPVTCTRVLADGVEVSYQGKSLVVPVLPRAGMEGAGLTLGIRPEHITLEPGDLTLRVTPSVVEQLGQQTIGYAGLPGRDEHFCFVLPGTRVIEDDKPLDVSFTASECHLFDKDGKAFERRIDLAALTVPPAIG